MPVLFYKIDWNDKLDSELFNYNLVIISNHL